MLLTEYHEAEAMEMFRQEGLAEGRAEGHAEGRVEGIIDTLAALVRKGLLSIKDAAAQAGVTETVFQQMMLGK